MEVSVRTWTVTTRLHAIMGAIAIALASVLSIDLRAQAQAVRCTPSGQLVELRGLPEASGLAVSRRVSGRLWAHNDSGAAVLFALDSRGAIAGQVRITGASVEDWEALAAGPCGTGSCLYVGDIGDNNARRSRITVYRVPEPDAPTGTASVAGVFHATYPDGAHDAESLLIGRDGRLYVVTKGETGPLAMYRFPAQMKSGEAVRLERVALAASQPDADSRITDGAFSTDGAWVILRSRSELTFYRASDMLAGRWRAVSSFDLSGLKEPQGEGLAVGPESSLFLAGEGGGRGRSGTFARVSCALPDDAGGTLR
jgi:hypothetical protein